MKVRILLILFLMLSFSAYSWLNMTTLSSAENKAATMVTEEEIPVEENDMLPFHVFQKTNIFSILIVGLEIFIIIYLVGITWHSGLR